MNTQEQIETAMRDLMVDTLLQDQGLMRRRNILQFFSVVAIISYISIICFFIYGVISHEWLGMIISFVIALVLNLIGLAIKRSQERETISAIEQVLRGTQIFDDEEINDLVNRLREKVS